MPPFNYSLIIEDRFSNRCFNPILNIIKRYNAKLTGTTEDANGIVICFLINPSHPDFHPNDVNDLFDCLINHYRHINLTLYHQFFRQRHYTCNNSNIYYTDDMQREDNEEKDDF